MNDVVFVILYLVFCFAWSILVSEVGYSMRLSETVKIIVSMAGAMVGWVILLIPLY